MTATDVAADFEADTDLTTEGSTVIVGLPGLGLAGVIAVGHLTDQLGLPYRGRLVSERFPRVATYADGRYRDPVRVYGGEESQVTAVRADLAFPPRSHGTIAEGVVTHLTPGRDQVILPIGAPADTVEDHGTVTAVTTSETLEAILREGGVPLAPGVGVIGGPTGALLTTCARSEIPTIALVVRVEPYRPDPAAAGALLNDGREAVVDFDIDTSALEQREAELATEMDGMARQM